MTNKLMSKYFGGILAVLLITSSLPLQQVHAETVTTSMENISIVNDETNKTVEIKNEQLSMSIDYNNQLRLSSLKMGGIVEVLDEEAGGVSALLPDSGQAVLSASYTNAGDKLAHINDGIISYTEEPRNRWTSYRADRKPVASDWITYQFFQSVNVDSVQLHIFSDSGYIAPPASYQVEYWDGNNFVAVEEAVADPQIPTGNMLNALTFKPVITDRMRLVLNNKAPGEGKTAYYTGITEVSWLYQNKEVGKGAEWSGTDSLVQSPDVAVEQNRIVFDNVHYMASGVPIEEKWIFEVLADDVKLTIERIYREALLLSDQKSLAFSFKQDAFDVIQRTEDGGSFQLLDPGLNENGERRSLNRFLSRTPYSTDPSVNPEKSNVIRTGSWYGNEKFSIYTANMDFLDKLHNRILSIELSSNRNRASHIWRAPLEEGGALTVEHKLSEGLLSLGGSTGSFANISGAERYLPLGIFQKNNFLPVVAKAGQVDLAVYSFKADNSLDKYYDIGYIPDTATIDSHTLAQFIQDYARSSVIDLNVGMGDTDVSGMGPYETWWYSRNAQALQGAGNENYLETLKNFVRFNKQFNFPIHGSGRLYAVSARENVWYKDNFFDTYGQFIAGITAIYDLSADDEWLQEIKDMARKVLDWAAFTRDINNDGLMESFGYDVTQWDDHSKIGQNSAYANAFLYKALIDWAELEEKVLLDQPRADRYRDKAAQLKETYNKPIDQGGFWSEETSSYVHSRGLQGEVYGDVAHNFENTYSIIFGIADTERANIILEKYTDFRNGNNNFNEPLKLFPAQRYAYNKSENNAKFPSYLHGNSFPQMTYDMMAAYAKIGNYDIPEELLRTVVEQYDWDGLIWNTYTWGLEPDTLREPWMSANVRPGAGFYDIIMGIKPKYDRLVIDPAITENMYGASVKYTLRGLKYQITHVNALERKIDAEATTQIESIWRGLENGKTYEVIDTNIASGNEKKTKLIANEGMVSYAALMEGEHRLSIHPAGKEPETGSGTDSGNGVGGTPGTNEVDHVELTWNGNKHAMGKVVNKGNGRFVIEVDPAPLAKLLAQEALEAGGSVLRALATEEQSSVILALNEQVVGLLMKHNVQLEMQANHGRFVLAPELLVQLAANNRSLQFEIALATDQKAQQIRGNITQSGYFPLTNPLQFTIKTMEGEPEIDIAQYGQFVQFSFILTPTEANQLHPFVTVMQINKDGTLSPRLTKLEDRGNGEWEAIFRSMDGGMFVLVQNELAFKDVESHWSKQLVNELGSRGILLGSGNQLFDPDKPMTRAEFAAILVRSLGLEQKSDNLKQEQFSDVSHAEWFGNHIQSAFEAGLIKGFDDGTFRPHQAITREQAIVILIRALQLVDKKMIQDGKEQASLSILQKFSDANSISKWAERDMAWAVQYGIVMGKSDEKLAASAQTTRAEFAAIIMRAFRLAKLI